MEKDKIFANGISFKLPSAQTKEKAPWVKAHLSIRSDDFIAFVKTHTKPDGWVNLDVKLSQKKNDDGSGKYYIELNTWNKEARQAEQEREAYLKSIEPAF